MTTHVVGCPTIERNKQADSDLSNLLGKIIAAQYISAVAKIMIVLYNSSLHTSNAKHQ